MPSWWKRRFQAGNERWLKAWEIHRRLGFLGFVLVWGFGRMGLLCGLLYTLIMFGLVWAWDGLPALEVKAGKMLLVVSVWIPIGVFGSVWLWFDTERKYKRRLREAGREPTPVGTGDPDAG